MKQVYAIKEVVGNRYLENANIQTANIANMYL